MAGAVSNDTRELSSKSVKQADKKEKKTVGAEPEQINAVDVPVKNKAAAKKAATSRKAAVKKKSPVKKKTAVKKKTVVREKASDRKTTSGKKTADTSNVATRSRAKSAQTKQASQAVSSDSVQPVLHAAPDGAQDTPAADIPAGSSTDARPEDSKSLAWMAASAVSALNAVKAHQEEKARAMKDKAEKAKAKKAGKSHAKAKANAETVSAIPGAQAESPRIPDKPEAAGAENVVKLGERRESTERNIASGVSAKPVKATKAHKKPAARKPVISESTPTASKAVDPVAPKAGKPVQIPAQAVSVISGEKKAAQIEIREVKPAQPVVRKPETAAKHVDKKPEEKAPVQTETPRPHVPVAKPVPPEPSAPQAAGKPAGKLPERKPTQPISEPKTQPAESPQTHAVAARAVSGRRVPVRLILMAGVIALVGLFGYRHWFTGPGQMAVETAADMSGLDGARRVSSEDMNQPAIAVAPGPVPAADDMAVSAAATGKSSTVTEPVAQPAPVQLPEQVVEDATATAVAETQDVQTGAAAVQQETVQASAPASVAEPAVQAADTEPVQDMPKTAPTARKPAKPAAAQPRYRRPAYGYYPQQPAWQPYYQRPFSQPAPR